MKKGNLYKNIAKKENIHCKKAAELISLQLDRPLSQKEKESLQKHLKICQACSNYKKQLTDLEKIFTSSSEIKDFSLNKHLPDEVCKKIKEAIKRNL